MRTWLLKRLLGFVPTLFLVLLVVFGVVNAVPAMPQDYSDAAHVSFRRTYDAFRRQFGLDLPVFVNLRHRLDAGDVRRSLAAVSSAPEEERPALLAGFRDLGRHAVPGLVAVAGDAGEAAALRDLALSELPALAGARPAAAGDRDVRARVWASWLAERQDVAVPGAWERLRITLFETRFGVYLQNLARLDFGVSMSNGQPVLPALVLRLGHSVTIALAAVVLSFLLAIPLGVLLAAGRGRAWERALSVLLFALYSLPTYFAATMLLRLFGVGEPFDWFPSGGLRSAKGYQELTLGGRLLDRVHHLALPVFCLTYVSVAVLSRYVRNSLLDVLSAPFVAVARAKGLSARAVLFRHALRNGLLPVLTFAGEILPFVFGGVVVIEVIFTVPGMGTYVYEAILNRDYNVILATTLISAVLTLVGYLLSDVLYAVFDPRVRFDRRGSGT